MSDPHIPIPDVCQLLKEKVNFLVKKYYDLGVLEIAIKNSYLRYRTLNHKDFEKFAATLKLKKIKLPDAIFVYQAKPVANILDMEPFMNKGQILRKISLGKSGEVLRNKIIRHDDEGINKISSQVSKVLGHNVKFHYINKANAISDEYIDNVLC